MPNISDESCRERTVIPSKPKMIKDSIVVLIVGMLFVNMQKTFSQEIVDDLWYSTEDVKIDVGYLRYGYVTYPAGDGDAGGDGILENSAPDLLPQSRQHSLDFEHALGDPDQADIAQGFNPDAQKVYSVVWDAGQLPVDAEKDLVIFDLGGLSSVSEIRLFTFLHTEDYNVPRLTFWINESNSPTSGSWKKIGEFEGVHYTKNGSQVVNVLMNTFLPGYYLKISARNNTEESEKKLSLGGVQIFSNAAN